MSSYPSRLPLDLDDVRRGHICGKVTDVNGHNQRWLRDALDIALRDGSCRFNCRSQREAYVAGFARGMEYSCGGPSDAEQAFREWKRESRS